MECRELNELAVSNLLGDLAEADRLRLDEHLGRCANCRDELAKIKEAWAMLGEDPEARLTQDFRRRTLDLLEEEMLRRRVQEFTPRRRWLRFAARAAALAIAATGGWLARRPMTTAPASAAAPSQAAASSRAPEGKLSNVTYHQSEPDGKVAVSFDVTSHRTVVGHPEEPAVANLLAYLVSQGTRTAGEKSQAIELVSSHYGTGDRPVSPEIVGALTGTLKHDENPGVRKKAADALAGFPLVPEIRAAFLDALAKDSNPAVRLVAVDALAAATKQAPDSRTIESLRERAFDPAENGFVRAKAASALKGVEF
jgi:hypothetical protein